MAEDWLADVRRYDANADEGVVDKIIKYCGIALRTPNASQVDFDEPTETDRVRENFLKKKLGRSESDASLDAAIAAVGERMAGDATKNRVTVYYLLADHLDALGVFGATVTAATATAAPAMAATASTPAAPAATPPAAPYTAFEKHEDEDDEWRAITGIGCIAGLVMFGAIIFAAVVALWASNTILEREPAPEPVAAPAPAPVPAPVVPEGAGVTASERDGRPMLTVYFDSGSSVVTPDFETVSTDLRAYLDANPDSTVQISGFNDPTGDAEINARLSRERAQNVQAALTGLGLAEARTDLVRPDDTTTEELSNAEARRVEITVAE